MNNFLSDLAVFAKLLLSPQGLVVCGVTAPISAMFCVFRNFCDFHDAMQCEFPSCLFHDVVPWSTMTLWRATESYGCTVSYLLATHNWCKIFELWPFGELQSFCDVVPRCCSMENYDRMESFRGLWLYG